MRCPGPPVLATLFTSTAFVVIRFLFCFTEFDFLSEELAAGFGFLGNSIFPITVGAFKIFAFALIVSDSAVFLTSLAIGSAFGSSAFGSSTAGFSFLTGKSGFSDFTFSISSLVASSIISSSGFCFFLGFDFSRSIFPTTVGPTFSFFIF